MNRSTIVTLMCKLNSGNFKDCEDLEELFKDKYERTLENLACTEDEILKKVCYIVNTYQGNSLLYEFKYVCLNFYLLELLREKLSESNLEILSVQETKVAKESLAILMHNGVLKHIQPKLPHFVEIKINKNEIIDTYNLLKCTTVGFITALKYSEVRMLILPHLLREILVATIQLAYCPLKKPSKNKKEDKFFMSEEAYNKFMKDQEIFKETLENLRHNIHPAFFVKEAMNLFQADSPQWFKKSVSNILTKIITSREGTKHVCLAMLDGCDDDTTKSWKIIDILTKLIMSCIKHPDFHSTICSEVLNLTEAAKNSDHDLLIYERLTISCTKSLYLKDEEMCQTIFLNQIMAPLLDFAYKRRQFSSCDDVTADINQSVRLIYGCFVDSSVDLPCLSPHRLKTVINVIFTFYHLTVKSSLQTTNKELKEVLIKYMESCTDSECGQLFDNFLFGFDTQGVVPFRDDLIVEIDKGITVKQSQHTIIHATAEVADTLFNFLNTNRKITLFGYLLNCVTMKDKYFPTDANKDLLEVEEQFASSVLQRLLTIHQLLSQLAESKEVQRSLKEKPEGIIKYINNALASKVQDSEFVFTIIMILDNLIENCSVKNLEKYQILCEPISEIASKTSNTELKNICEKILISLKDKKVNDTVKPDNEVTEFEKALEDIRDPLLPVRGHALLVLSKLVEKKDKQAMERRQYLLNLFQLHLKDQDSFIYLSSIQGLSALGDAFPDTVLQVLCEEYSDFGRRDPETRTKLGESLVRVVKSLGEMAPKYKSLLLNTFLSGTKDDDHLVRASSLSNLGEVCRVLHYKLGTVVTEVLVCVHAVITTDKAAEARRAAVTVIRQLLVGLQTEMIAFLKEEILAIYRTLKEIHHNDRDDVMRLQAQLALEELNENVKDWLFAKPQLNLDKKTITLD